MSRSLYTAMHAMSKTEGKHGTSRLPWKSTTSRAGTPEELSVSGGHSYGDCDSLETRLIYFNHTKYIKIFLNPLNGNSSIDISTPEKYKESMLLPDSKPNPSFRFGINLG